MKTWKCLSVSRQSSEHRSLFLIYQIGGLDNWSYTDDTKKRELLKNPTKIEEIQENKFTDRNWTIKTCLL